MGKRPSQHGSPVVRLQRRIRNFRRRVYAWVAAGFAAVVFGIPYRVLRPVSRACLPPVLKLLVGRAARRNLRLAYGNELSESRQREILREMFRGTASMLAEWNGHVAQGPRFFDGYLDAAETRRKIEEFERSWPGGWIGVTGHIGNWELLGQWVCHISSKGMAGSVAKRQPNPHLNRLIEKLRGRHGMATLYREDPPKAMIRALRDGRVVGIVPDQDVPSLSGVFIDFLGRPAYTPVGPARVALASGMPLMVLAMLRRGDRFEVIFNEPIYPDPSRPRGEEILRLTMAWSRQLEELVRTHPEQWPWFHDRWKTTPASLEARDRKPLQL